MNERVKFVARYLQKEEPFSALCEHAGISRKTGYKWVERYDAGGVAALVDRSRAPRSHPHAVSSAVVERIVATRRRHPRWGPRKLLAILRRQEPARTWPAASTVGDVLRQQGLVRRRRRRRCSVPYGERLAEYAAPNAIWCADFKGHFPVGDARCHPLTIMDGFSRYLLRCQALPRPLSAPSQAVFESAFREYGLPETIRTDNGAPFSTLAPGGLSRLAVWWIRLGIRPERILPGRPDQNGRHERMHSTLKAETARPPRSSFRAQQRCFEAFRREYNHERPHEALTYETPASRYVGSPRAYPRRLPHPDYPAHFRVERAYPNGVISVGDTQWYLSNCLAGELVGLDEVDDDRWTVYLGRSSSACWTCETPRRGAPASLGYSSGRTARSHRAAADAADLSGERVRVDSWRWLMGRSPGQFHDGGASLSQRRREAHSQHSVHRIGPPLERVGNP